MNLYYASTSFQSIGSGKRNENYHLCCVILDENGAEVVHHLNDNYFGKWAKCQSIINKFNKNAERAGILNATLDILNKWHKR